MRILRLINSSFYAAPMKVDSLQEAASLLGLSNLRDLVIAIKLAERFEQFSGETIDLLRFWQNTFYAAAIARDLYRALGHKRFNLFAVVMLHHVGVLILLQKFPVKMKAMLESVKRTRKELHDAERAALGYSHAEVGADLLDAWGLPEVFSEVTRYHHDFFKTRRYAVEAAIVHLADSVAQRHIPVLPFEGIAMEPDLAVYRYVTLSPQRLSRLYKTVKAREGDASALLG